MSATASLSASSSVRPHVAFRRAANPDGKLAHGSGFAHSAGASMACSSPHPGAGTTR